MMRIQMYKKGVSRNIRTCAVNTLESNWSTCILATNYVASFFLFRSTYLNRLAENVNDKLQEAGLISITELCKNYDLPGDFLSEVSHSVQLPCVYHIRGIRQKRID